MLDWTSDSEKTIYPVEEVLHEIIRNSDPVTPALELLQWGEWVTTWQYSCKAKANADPWDHLSCILAGLFHLVRYLRSLLKALWLQETLFYNVKLGRALGAQSAAYLETKTTVI